MIANMTWLEAVELRRCAGKETPGKSLICLRGEDGWDVAQIEVCWS